ncbi:MAG: acyl-CoA thioesterase [bacterium]
MEVSSQSLPLKPVAQSQVTMTEMVLPQHTNALGSVFGGTVMSWVDIAAATCAMRHCAKQVVTASVDAMHFLAPVKLGWVVTIQASVNYVGGTSCEIGVKVISENPISGERFHTASAYLTFVALDSHGKPTTIPGIILQSDEEKRRHASARLRRESRLKLKTELQARRDDQT